MNTKNKYKLLENVRIYFNGEDEIRFRKGIWSYEEATLVLDSLDDNVKQAFFELVKLFSNDETVDLKDIHSQFKLIGEEYGLIRNVFDSLEEQRYIEKVDANFTQKFVKEIIGGTISEFMTSEVLHVGPILFVTDNHRLKEYAEMVADDLEINLTYMSEAEMKRIEEADILDKTEAMKTEADMNELERSVFPFSCVVVSLERPRLKFLRKLNRLLIKSSIPMVLTVLDGPFISISSMKGNETACYECYENRVIARNQELSSYRRFYEQTGGMGMLTQKTYMTPIVQMFTTFALFEAFLLASVGKCKMAGRVLNVYLPIMEIQVQDLLRIPYCPSCGHVAKAKYNEMYTTSKEVVRNLVDKVMIERSIDREARLEGQV